MRFKSKLGALALAGAVAVGLFATAGRSDDNSAAPPNMQEMMATMMKMNTPGPEHAALKKLVGKFTAECSFKMAADAPEMTSKGEEENTMILNDHYLQSKYTGDMMGMPFHGIALVGYDNYKKKHCTLWIDDGSTGMAYSEGTADATGKVVTYSGTMPCPMQGGKEIAYRNVLTHIDDDHYQMEMFQPGPDGKEFRGMLIKYSRAQ